MTILHPTAPPHLQIYLPHLTLELYLEPLELVFHIHTTSHLQYVCDVSDDSLHASEKGYLWKCVSQYNSSSSELYYLIIVNLIG